MQSHIAAYRFVHLRGLWYARPLDRGDAGPVVAEGREGETFRTGGTRRMASAHDVSRRAAPPEP